MSTPMRRFILFVALLSQSCLGGSCFPFLGGGGGGGGGVCSGGGFGIGTYEGPAEAVHYANQPVTMKIVFDSGGVSCTGTTSTAPSVTSVNVELVDPENRPVDANATVPVKVTGLYGGEAWETTLTFTPAGPGSYHLLVTFEPGVGLVQRDIWVVNDRRDETPAGTTLSASRCAHAERTTAGSIVCQDGYNGVVLFRGGAEVASWDFGTGHVAGNIIWILGSGSNLSRNLDTGTGPPQLTASTNASTGGAVFAASENEVLVWANDRLRLYRYANGTLSNAAEVVMGVASEPDALAFSLDAGSIVFGDDDRWTRLDMPTGVSQPTPAWKDGESATYQAPDGVWIALDATSFRFVPADKNQPMVTLVAPLGWQNDVDKLVGVKAGERPMLFPMKINDRTSGDPSEPYQSLDKSQVLVPVVNGSSVQLSHFRTVPDAGFVEVSGGMLRAMRGDTAFFYPLTP